jgi:hypothetical protein
MFIYIICLIFGIFFRSLDGTTQENCFLLNVILKNKMDIIFSSKTTFSKSIPRQPTVLIARDSLNDSEASQYLFRE